MPIGAALLDLTDALAALTKIRGLASPHHRHEQQQRLRQIHDTATLTLEAVRLRMKAHDEGADGRR